jgi:hypothetical protein
VLEFVGDPELAFTDNGRATAHSRRRCGTLVGTECGLVELDRTRPFRTEALGNSGLLIPAFFGSCSLEYPLSLNSIAFSFCHQPPFSAIRAFTSLNQGGRQRFVRLADGALLRSP